MLSTWEQQAKRKGLGQRKLVSTCADRVGRERPVTRSPFKGVLCSFPVGPWARQVGLRVELCLEIANGCNFIMEVRTKSN